jgi:hypothetical protein
VNVIGVPRWGYAACAWGGFAGYGVAMLLSACIGQKKYPIPYDLRGMLHFVVIGALLYGTSLALSDWLGVKADDRLFTPRVLALLGCNTLLIFSYCTLVWREIKASR